MLNYLKMENSANFAFAVFVPVWSYLRHYLNIVILVSVWNEFDLIPYVSYVVYTNHQIVQLIIFLMT